MPMTETTRKEANGAADLARVLPDPAAFRGSPGEEDALVSQLAFARAIERGETAPAPETIAALRAQATADLSDFAFRYLHNRVEEVRRDAVASLLSQLGRPPGFARLVLANLIALALAGAAGLWLATHPETLAGLIGQ